MKLADPATAITDYVLAVEAIVFASLLFQAARGQISVLLWGAAFVAVGVSALSGGIFHHGRLELDASTCLLLGRIVAAGLFLSVILYVASGVMASLSGYVRTACLVALAFAAAGCLRMGTATQGTSDSGRFLWILVPVFLTLITGLLLLWMRQGSRTGLLILAGSIFCVAGVIIQQAAPRIYRHFNHNDLCHVLFMIGLVFLYLGGLLLQDKP